VSQHSPGQLGAALLHSSLCCCFFSATLSIYLVSEEYPSSMIQTFLGLPIIWVGTVASQFRFRFLRAFSISSCVISTIMQSGRSFCLLSGEKSHFCIVSGVTSQLGRRAHICRAVKVSQAAILEIFHNEPHCFVMS